MDGQVGHVLNSSCNGWKSVKDGKNNLCIVFKLILKLIDQQLSVPQPTWSCMEDYDAPGGAIKVQGLDLLHWPL